ncbi:MAG: hypothetical protein K6346_00320 [Halothiobacillaceae bacterium]
MRVTIYGGNGFFRHAIAHRLIKRGHEVKIIARRRSPSGGPAFMQAAPYGARQRREHLRNQEASINLVGISHNRPVDCERARIALAENDATPAAMTAAIDEALDYKTIAKRIIERVEGHHFLLLENWCMTCWTSPWSIRPYARRPWRWASRTPCAGPTPSLCA